eukprot:6177975-Pleurochrysis_carterae.AAC.3
MTSNGMPRASFKCCGPRHTRMHLPVRHDPWQTTAHCQGGSKSGLVVTVLQLSRETASGHIEEPRIVTCVAQEELMSGAKGHYTSAS